MSKKPRQLDSTALERALDDMRRAMDARPMFYPQAHTLLVDALREYIRSNEAILSGEEWGADAETMRAMREHVERCKVFLRLEIGEDFEIDPSLNGLLT